ncbi:MAG: cyclophilin-like fold protein [Candidatus Methanomethylicia archaeon]
MFEIEIICRSVRAKAVITLDENPNTARAIINSLPIKSKVMLWGDEIYFPVPVSLGVENARERVRIGELAYWPEEPSLCIFFGKTPISLSIEDIRAYSPVNVIGYLKTDPKEFKKVRSGDSIVVKLC